MSIYKLGQTRFTQPSCRGGFNPVITGLEVFKNGVTRKTHRMHLRQKQRGQSHLLGSQRKVIAFEMIVEVLAVLKYEGSRTIRFS